MSGYAARHGLVVQAMYQAASDLRKRGAWGDAKRARRPQKPAAFVKVSHEARPSGAGTWRARLPNGVVLEGNDTIGADLVKMLSAL